MHSIPRAISLNGVLVWGPRLRNYWVHLPQGLHSLNHADYSGYAPASLVSQWQGVHQSLGRRLALSSLAGHLAQFCSHSLPCSLAPGQTTLS